MTPETARPVNVKKAVPFFGIASMENSLRFYLEGLGFKMTNKWVVKDKIRWCWLEIGGAALMLQEFGKPPEGQPGIGVTICFQCEDALALYRDFRSRGISSQTPFVGNNMWVTGVSDPDGYSLSFQSPTNVPEETVLAE